MVVCHLLLSFYQSLRLRGDEEWIVGNAHLHIALEPVAWDSTIEFFFMCFEFSDVIMRYLAFEYTGGHILVPYSEKRFIYANFGVVLYIFVDWIVNLAANIR